MKESWKNVLMVSLMMVLSLFSVRTVSSAEKPISLKFAAVFPPPGISPTAEIADRWQKMITTRTNGQVVFENFWGASLGAPAEHIELLKQGTVQVVQTFQWYTPTLMPLGDFEYVFPFGPTDYEVVTKSMRKIRSEFPEFSKELANQNAIMIADIPQGKYNFLSKTPIKNLKDFEGLKVALIGRYFGRWLPPKATAVVRPAQERYDMLKNGVSNVDLNTIDNHYVFKLNEVTKYFVDNLSVLTACPMPIMMNLPKFNSLPPEYQKIILEAGQEVELIAAREIMPTFSEKALKGWKDKGTEFIRFPEDQKEAWAGTLEDIPAEWAAEVNKLGLPGTKIVTRWQEITSEMGYKWNRRWGKAK
jgi:TRAP-type C4-dicarboxylate transport system substrate-binding protein